MMESQSGKSCVVIRKRHETCRDLKAVRERVASETSKAARGRAANPKRCEDAPQSQATRDVPHSEIFQSIERLAALKKLRQGLFCMYVPGLFSLFNGQVFERYEYPEGREVQGVSV